MNNNKYEIIKFEDGDFSLDVNISPKEETVWLTQAQIADLFHKAQNRIIIIDAYLNYSRKIV